MKKTVFLFAFLLFLGFSFAQAAEAGKAEPKKAEAVKPADTTLKVFYKNGLQFETSDGKYTAHVGGRIQHDWLWATQENYITTTSTVGNFTDGAGFRRARLFVSGTVQKVIGYKLQLDFANSTTVGGTNFGSHVLKDAYISLHLPQLKKFLNIKVGHFKEPFGLEELTSSKYITFMERSGVSDLFAPSRNAGIMVYGNPNPMFTYALGFFKEAQNTGTGATEGDWNFAARFTAAPLYDKKSGKVAHVGLSYSYRPNTPRWRTRAGITGALGSPRVFDSGAFPTETKGSVLDLELAVAMGPFSFQAEFATGMADRHVYDGNNLNAWSYYMMVSFFLTGEHRPYNTKNGTFGRVKPKKAFMDNGGLGAIEVALRWDQSRVISYSGGILGGQGYSVTLGLNWYLYSNVRISANYVTIYLDDRATTTGHGKVNAFMMRFQVDF